MTPACASAFAALGGSGDYGQLAASVLNAWRNQAHPQAVAACAARTAPCAWNATSGTSTCLGDARYTFSTNATACIYDAYEQWLPFAYLVWAMELTGNASLAPAGGRNWWLDPAVATVDSSSGALVLQSLLLSRPFYLPDACHSDEDMRSLAKGFEVELCGASSNRSVSYCDVGLQFHADPPWRNRHVENASSI